MGLIMVIMSPARKLERSWRMLRSFQRTRPPRPTHSSRPRPATVRLAVGFNDKAPPVGQAGLFGRSVEHAFSRDQIEVSPVEALKSMKRSRFFQVLLAGS